MTTLGTFSSSHLRGRDAECRQLGDRVQAAATGSGGLIIIKGAVGTGKTWLIESAVKAAVAAGMVVARASYDAKECQAPLTPLLGALGARGRSHALNALGNRLLLVDQICGLIEERVARSPLLLVVDDAERVDASNLFLILRLAQRLAAYPLLWLLAVRQEGPDPLPERVLADLESLDGATSITLGPLSTEAVTGLVTELAGAPPDAGVLSLVSGVGGNPLAIVELLECLRDEGAIAVRNGCSCLTTAATHETLEQLIARRFEQLSAGTRQLLEVAAVFGRSFAVHDVAKVLAVPASRLLPSLQEARKAGLVVATATEALMFRNHFIRESLYDGLDEPTRLALHRQIGEMFLERGGAAREAAAHFLEGAHRGDHRVLAALDSAISETIRTAPRSAASLALQALDLTEPADPARLDRTVSAVEALTVSERLQDAEDLAHSSLVLDPTPGVPAAQLRLALAWIHFIEARPAEAVRHAEAVLEQLKLPTEIHGAAEVALLMGLIAQNDLQRARMSAEALLAGTDGPDSQLALSAAAITLGCLAWNEGRLGPALGLVRAGIKRADRFTWEGSRPHPRLRLADMLIAIGEFDDADNVLTECHEEIELSEDALYRAGPVIGRASLHLAAGRPAEALVDAEAGLSIAQRLGTWLFLPRAKRILASITLSRGDLSGALTLLGTTVEDTRFATDAIASGGPFVGGQLLELRQGPARCVEALASVYDDLSSHKPLLIEEPAAAAWLVRTALAAGDRQRAEAVVACSAQVAADNPTFPSVGAGAAHCRGVLNRDVAALELACADHRHPWARASAVEDAGTVLTEHGDSAEACERFEKALDSYDQIGFERDAARVRARLRRLGIRHRHWNHVDRPSWGWESLTDTEVTVTDLVAEGLTNPQVATRMYLSRHTVDFHLRQIFRKLAIGSRVDLTRLALEAKNRTQSAS